MTKNTAEFIKFPGFCGRKPDFVSNISSSPKMVGRRPTLRGRGQTPRTEVVGRAGKPAVFHLITIPARIFHERTGKNLFEGAGQYPG